MHGVRLVLLRPDASSRDCGECVRWLHHDSPEHMGERVERPAGRPVPRGASRPPCRACPKQPYDVPERDRRPGTAEELSAKNLAAYGHYLRCRAVGRFPDDEIVARNAALIRAAEDAAARVERVNLAQICRSPLLGD